MDLQRHLQVAEKQWHLPKKINRGLLAMSSLNLKLLLGIIVNLLTYSGFYDVALRDFGLLLGASALGRLSEVYQKA